MKHKLILISLAFMVIMLLGNCNGETATDIDKSPLRVPEGESNLVSPLDTPVTAPVFLPTPSFVDKAVVGGILVRDLPGTGEELAIGTEVQLAEVIRASDGTPMMVAASEEDSPITTTDERGQFVFTEVSSGTYGLVVVTPLGSFLIKDKTGQDLLFDIPGGEIVNLGRIWTDLPY